MTRPGGDHRTGAGGASPSIARVVGVRLAAVLTIVLTVLTAAGWEGAPPTHKVTLYRPGSLAAMSWKVRRPLLTDSGAVCWRTGPGPEVTHRPVVLLAGQHCVIGTVVLEPL